ncbi:hypothetical protein [Dictyobacter arantiisoli]|uniref:Uncharacterized protein n=1 Tax=Dictyobacter arantiisoli TaxID=2014874 RepID=A0A5A5T690_9CHLR|nr:hypothetical protein [Dictyobacter arantiisoli]GCF06524.1 hypothetical protein KDI_00880 [Dictyobacter arantiisoli]
MASSSVAQEQVFIGPGLSLFKRVVTIIGLIAIVALILWIAVYQHANRNDASVIGSTIAAILFVAGFAYYLRLVAPVSFTITLTPTSLVRTTGRGETIDLKWEDIPRIKEEFFPNGKRISINVYRKVTEPGQKAKAWAVYRDDIKNLDTLAESLQQIIPPTCQWERETVHD